MGCLFPYLYDTFLTHLQMLRKRICHNCVKIGHPFVDTLFHNTTMSPTFWKINFNIIYIFYDDDLWCSPHTYTDRVRH